MISKIFYLFTLILFSQNAIAQEIEVSESSVQVRSSDLNRAERSVREAAVKVERYDARGYGSGTLMRLGDDLVVSTAAHVVGNQDIMIIHGRDGEYQLGRVIYCDSQKDIAFVHVEEMETRSPVRYRPVRRGDVVGTEITYTGFPNGSDLITVNGTVAGDLMNRSVLIMQSYAWMGASGSGVFDMSGNYLGAVVAVQIGRAFDVQIIETMVYVTPAWNVNQAVLERRLEQEIPPLESTISGIPSYTCEL